MTDGAEGSAPALRIVNAEATPEEVAAVIAVFSALGGPSETPRKPAPAWSALHRRLRPQHPHGRGGWRSSGLPR